MRISKILYYGANCAQFANVQMQSSEKIARLYGTLQPWKFWISCGCVAMNFFEFIDLFRHLRLKGRETKPSSDLNLGEQLLIVGSISAFCVFFSWPLFLITKDVFYYASSLIKPQTLSSLPAGSSPLALKCKLSFSSECFERSTMQFLSLWNTFLSLSIILASRGKINNCGSAAIFLGNGLNSFKIARWKFLKVTYTNKSPPYYGISEFIFSNVFQVFESKKGEFCSLDLNGNRMKLLTVIDDFCEKCKSFRYPSYLRHEIGANPTIRNPFSFNLLLNHEVRAMGILK